MPTITDLKGPAGSIEAILDQPALRTATGAPRAAVVFAHPHPQFGGTMHTKVVFHATKALARIGVAVLRFNFRGVGRSQGSFDHGQGELSDAAAALDWAQATHPDARACWIAGVSFGTWIAMQLLMRRPEIDGFICVAPPANLYDFSFLAPCPSSGLMINGDKDRVVPSASVADLSVKTKVQKGVKIEHAVVPNANHFFQDRMEDLMKTVGIYLDRRIAEIAKEREGSG